MLFCASITDYSYLLLLLISYLTLIIGELVLHLFIFLKESSTNATPIYMILLSILCTAFCPAVHDLIELYRIAEDVHLTHCEDCLILHDSLTILHLKQY